MSHNLYFRTGIKKLNVLQTPTYITNMCLMSDTGVKGEVRGKHARRALLAYMEWVKEYFDHEAVSDHIKDCKKFLEVSSLEAYSS